MNIETTDLRVYKTRQSIKLALIELLTKKNISNVTVTELSLKAMVNRKTFYRHYSTVDDVYADIERELTEDVIKAFDKEHRTYFDVADALRHVGEMIKSNKRILRRITKHNPDLFFRGYIEVILKDETRHAIRQVAASSSVSDFEVEFLSSFIVSGIVATYVDWFKNDCKGDVEEIANTINRLAANGLSAFIPENKLVFNNP